MNDTNNFKGRIAEEANKMIAAEVRKVNNLVKNTDFKKLLADDKNKYADKFYDIKLTNKDVKKSSVLIAELAKENGFDNESEIYSIFDADAPFFKGQIMARNEDEAAHLACNYGDVPWEPEDADKFISGTNYNNITALKAFAILANNKLNGNKTYKPTDYHGDIKAAKIAAAQKPAKYRDKDFKIIEAHEDWKKQVEDLEKKLADAQKKVADNAKQLKSNDGNARARARKAKPVLEQLVENLTKQLNTLKANEKKLEFSEKSNMFSDLIQRVRRVNNFALTGKFYFSDDNDDDDIVEEVDTYVDENDSEAYCDECGCEVQSGWQHCPECGNSLQ